MKLAVITMVAALAAVVAGPALAHHSFAMFDREKTMSVTGTVKEVEWENPHVWIHLLVPDQKTGKQATWSFEMGSIGQISNEGWKSDSVKVGDKVTIVMHPMKDGSRGGQYTEATLADGRTLKPIPTSGRLNYVP